MLYPIVELGGGRFELGSDSTRFDDEKKRVKKKNVQTS